jgi:uncharacterized protein (UPF0261 family)
MPIVVVGMLDEREEALRIIKDRIEKLGHQAILIDMSIGTGAIRPDLKPDVGSDELALLGGGTLETIKKRLSRERERAVSAMAEGLTKKVLELHQSGKLQGIIAIAGMTGTFISITAMKALPFGVPKLLISSATANPVYANKFADYFRMNDISVMHSVVDTVGMNPWVRILAANGANAICGMVEGFEPIQKESKPTIAITEFGFVEKGARYVRELLEKDYTPVSFHATGLGDRTARDMVSQGLFQAFIDLVPASFSEYLFGGVRASGPDRLDGARDSDIPYILAPCGFDMIGCGPIERRDKGDPLWVSRNLAARKFLVQDTFRVQARTTVNEMEIIARSVADKLNRYKNKKLVKFVIPKKGFSSLSVEGGALFDPTADQAFITELRKNLDPEIRIFEVESHINTPEFAKVVVEALQESFSMQGKKTTGVGNAVIL